MCDYSNAAKSNLDCLDHIDDILTLDRRKRLEIREEQHGSEVRGGVEQGIATGQRSGSSKVMTETVTRGSGTEPVICDAVRVDGSDRHLYHLGSRPTTLLEEQQFSETESLKQQAKSNSTSWKNDNLITCMLITANVGTIFEESTLLDLWFKQLKSYLTKIKPQLVAIHCQEVGGKNYETSMKNISNFTDQILGDQTIVGDYPRVRIFLDENFQCIEKFTALGSLYLIHDSVDNVKLYNFRTAQYDPVEGKCIFAVSDKDDLIVAEKNKKPTTNNMAEHVEKVKFPQELFPECRWSRKGFMRTRWLFNDSQPLDLVNIHLFHDASNLVAMKATPSPYAQTRQKALEYALRRIALPLKVIDSSNNNIVGLKHYHDDQVPLFIFGDFNFRLDTNRVIQKITEGVSPVVRKSSNNDEVLEFVYHRKTTSNTAKSSCDCSNQAISRKNNNLDNGNESKTPNLNSQKDDDNRSYIGDCGVVMTIGKKLFDCENLDEMFRAAKNTEWLLKLDNELDSFRNELHEFRISFSPSYPFKEDETGGYSYMKTRCPSWCDRILFNSAGNRIIYGKNLNSDILDYKKRIELLQSQGDVIYRLMGNSVPMGDHKPVLLYCQLKLGPESPPLKCNIASKAIKESTSGFVQSTAM